LKTTSVPLTIISGSSTSIDSTGRSTTTKSAVKETETSSVSRSSQSLESSSKTSESSSPKQTDSAPFTNTNSGAVKLGDRNSWVWLGLMAGMAMMWI
jgi:hypothetical protein